MLRCRFLNLATVATAILLGNGASSNAFDLVIGGKPVATIVSSNARPPEDAPAAKGKKKNVAVAGDEALAGRLLVEWVKKISDAELPTATTPPKNGPTIYIGQAALDAGLKLDDIVSPTHEGLRIVVEENRVLIAGQTESATAKAVCRFLEQLGCRYFMDGPLGEVFPRSPDVKIQPLTITEKPGLLYRNPKGPSWNAKLWKLWNGAGGEPYNHAHSWNGYLPKGLFQEHPEYFAMGKDGQRKEGEWICTSNPGLRELFAQQVIAKIKAGNIHPSLSPTDGRGYCQCPTCLAQDDPKSLEPSSGMVAVSNRYADFFDDVARRVAKEQPDAKLSFICYADYTQPPTFERKLSPNLCAVIAPIRYCRMHEIGHEDCPSRLQQLEMVDGWAKLASHLGYYNYMYDLSDATLPMFKYTSCKTEFPYLANKGLDFMTIEVLSNWYIYGPQIYLSLRMAYDPKADAAAVMDDYWQKFYGPAAEPMKSYWMTIDRATSELHAHAGGFYGLSAVYTPARLTELKGHLDRAKEAAKNDPVYTERVAMTTAGLDNAADYKTLCNQMASGDGAGGRVTFDRMVERIDGLVTKHYANPEYGTSYLKRFLGKGVTGCDVATAAPNKLIQALPDRWRFQPDDTDEGLTKGYATMKFDDSKWREIGTHSTTLSAQDIKSENVLWYRTKITAPKANSHLSLCFLEVDGLVDVFVNGQPVAPTSILPPAVKPPAKKPRLNKNAAVPVAPAPAVPAQVVAPPAVPLPAAEGIPAAVVNADRVPEGTIVGRRAPFWINLPATEDGQYVISVRVDNRKISELFLGGITRPVLLIERPAGVEK